MSRGVDLLNYCFWFKKIKKNFRQKDVVVLVILLEYDVDFSQLIKLFQAWELSWNDCAWNYHTFSDHG
jgi:hypothetical protein